MASLLFMIGGTVVNALAFTSTILSSVGAQTMLQKNTTGMN